MSKVFGRFFICHDFCSCFLIVRRSAVATSGKTDLRPEVDLYYSLVIVIKIGEFKTKSSQNASLDGIVDSFCAVCGQQL